MESLESFLQIEKEYDLLDRKIRNIPYWMYIRVSLFNLLDKKSNDIDVKFSILDKIKIYLDILLKSEYCIMPKLKKCNVLIMNHPRRILEDGYYECIYTDKLVEKLESVQVLEIAYHLGFHFKPIKTSNCIYIDKAALKGVIIEKIERKFQRNKYDTLKKELEAEAIFLQGIILKKMEIQIDVIELRDMLVRQYYFYTYAKPYLKKIIQYANPKVLVEVVYYARINMLANEISHELGIPVIELQHGGMGSNHVAYNFLEKVEYPQLPDEILTFSNYWINNTRFPKKMTAAGYPYYERKVAEYADVRKENIIIFISQKTIGNTLSQFAVGFDSEIKRLNQLDKYKIVYKLHPHEYEHWQKHYPILAKCGIEVIDNNKQSIYELFAKSIVQVGVYSTALYEGMGFNLKTFLVKAYRVEDFEALCKEGYAQMVDSPKDIIDYLVKMKEESKDNKETYFWEKDALTNICEEIGKYL